MRASCWFLPVVVLVGASCTETRAPRRSIGEPCAPLVAPGETSTDCVDGLCVALDTASGFCTRNCIEQSDCPEDFECVGAGRYGKVCKAKAGCKEDNDCPSGHSCNPESGNCYIKVSRTLCSTCQDSLQCPEGGACFTAVGSLERFCTVACDANQGCPIGFECQPLPVGKDGALVSQCVPTSSSCNLGRELCARCEGDDECGGPFDQCVRNVVSNETFCGRDCEPAKNQCPTAGCDPLLLDSAPNPDCPKGFSCTYLGNSNSAREEGPYQCVPNSNTCSGYCDSADEQGQLRQCGLGRACDLTQSQCGPATDGRQCAACTDNDDCRKGPYTENRCIVNNCPDCPFRGESFCASPCADDSACVRRFGPGFECNPVVDSTGQSRNYCMPQRGTCRSGLGQLGDPCMDNGGGDCLSGVCLAAGNTALCSLPCAKDNDCGDGRFVCCEYSAKGYDCSGARRSKDGPLSGAGVCAPLGGLLGDDCSPGRPPCQSGTCLNLGTASLCTVRCEEGCPSGFSCRSALLDGVATPADICFPDGGGQAGADCSFGPAACESGLCIRKDSGPVCTQGCASNEDCPEEWVCELLSTVDRRSIQGCLPPSLQ